MEKEANALVVEKADQELKVELVEKDGEYYLRTIYLITSRISMFDDQYRSARQSFRTEQYFENADGTPIRFDSDYFGNHRGLQVILFIASPSMK